MDFPENPNIIELVHPDSYNLMKGRPSLMVWTAEELPSSDEEEGEIECDEELLEYFDH